MQQQTRQQAQQARDNSPPRSVVAVRPPEYFPRLAYLALMQHAERFVLADTFQYSRQSFQNRARLRTPPRPRRSWQWISVPLKGGQHGRPICEVEVDVRGAWQRSHWRAFRYNYQTAPFFDHYEAAFRDLFETPWTSLGALTCATTELLHRLFGLPSALVRASTLPEAPGDLRALVGHGGTLLTSEAAAEHDCGQVASVQVMRYQEPVYQQNFDGFEPGLSAVDLLFNYGPAAPKLIRRGVTIL
ncbi:MAG: WbqC family protein [Rhodothermales bacterium]